MRRTLTLGAVFAVLALAAAAAVLLQDKEPMVRIGGESVRVSIADDVEERQRGLSDTDGLAEDEGMLFVFEADGIHSMWMKDMRFAIDIIWISADEHIVHIERNVDPSSYPQTFTSGQPARYILEVAAGWTSGRGVGEGDSVRLKHVR
jgi:hypothetical protein